MKYRFGDIATNITEKRAPKPEDKYNYIGLEHLDSGSLYVNRYGLDVEIKGDKLVMHKGDVLLGKRNAYLRRAAIAPHDGLFSAHGMILRPKENVVTNRFFPFFVASDKFFDEVIRISVGGLSPTVNWKDLKELEFNLPSLAEQKVLAEKLWAAYEVKQSYLRMIEATQEMVKSQFIEMFGTIDTPHYDTVTLTTISENLDSMRIPIKSGNRVDGQYPYYGASGIVDYVGDYIFDDDILLISEDGANLKDRVTPIAFSSSGKVWVNNHAHVLRFKDANLQRYVECYFNYNRIDKYLTGTAQPKLNQDKLNSIPIPLPSGEVLTKFISIYNQADKSGFELRKSIDAIDKVIKSLINENL